MSDYSASIASHYHQRTKYDPQTLATRGKALDWSQQPEPFKFYKIGTVYDLNPYLIEDHEWTEEEIKWQRLSKFLFYSYGLTAKIPTMAGDCVYLRTAPSAGGLYPAEIYLISRGTALLPAGLYHYQPQSHCLVRFWDNHVWSELQEACFFHPALAQTQLALVTSAIFHRSSWRYEDRAYRRVFLDTGHLLSNITLAASLTGYESYLLGGFIDRLMNKLFYFESQEEAVTSIIALKENPAIAFSGPTALASGCDQQFPTLPDGQLLGYLHQASEIMGEVKVEKPSKQSQEDKYNFPFCLKVAMQSEAIDWDTKLSLMGETLLKRRSTRAYTGQNIELSQLQKILQFTYHPETYLAQNMQIPSYFNIELIETFVAVSGVNGLEEGCYYYAPRSQELRQIRFKNFRQELHYLCLGQNLGRDAAAVVFHTADLVKAVEKYGDRAYRYLHMDAGHLGQRMNLATIRLGLGVSGIGGFFDDQVNEILGIPDDEAALYITTLGVPGRG